MKKVTFLNILVLFLVVLLSALIFIWPSAAQTQLQEVEEIIMPVEDLTGLHKRVYRGSISLGQPDNGAVLNANGFPETKRPIARYEWEEYCSSTTLNLEKNLESFKVNFMRRSIFWVIRSTDKYFQYYDNYDMEIDIQSDIINFYNAQPITKRCKGFKFRSFSLEFSK